MSEVKTDRKYTETHEWVLEEDDDIICVGITDHAQDLMGDMVFVELPEVGTEIIAGQEICVVESVKAASDVYSPLTGEVIEVNEELTERPELVNQDPFGDGWLFKLKISSPTTEELLDSDAYEELLGQS